MIIKKKIWKIAMGFGCFLTFVLGHTSSFARGPDIEECSINTTIEAVYLGHHAWSHVSYSAQMIGIKTSDNKLYYSRPLDVERYGDTRTLLQLALSAFVSKAPIVVYKTNVNNCFPSPIGGENWIRNWTGLRLN